MDRLARQNREREAAKEAIEVKEAKVTNDEMSGKDSQEGTNV